MIDCVLGDAFGLFSFAFLYPEWPHIGKVVASHAEGCRVDSGWGCTDLYHARGAQEVLPMRAGGATSQLDLPPLTPISVAGWGLLQLGVPHWATSIDSVTG